VPGGQEQVRIKGHMWRRSVTALVLVVQAADCYRWSVHWHRNFTAPPQSERAEQVEFDWMQSASSLDHAWQ